MNKMSHFEKCRAFIDRIEIYNIGPRPAVPQFLNNWIAYFGYEVSEHYGHQRSHERAFESLQKIETIYNDKSMAYVDRIKNIKKLKFL